MSDQDSPTTEEVEFDLFILPWDEDHLADSLNQVYKFAVEETQDQIGYYQKQSRPKKRWARWLRALAIIATALGGIIPMFSQITIGGYLVGNFIQPVWASVAIALAATFLGLDRFFGFSTAWMRFISSELELRNKLQAFQYEWAYQKIQWRGKPPTYEQAQEMVLRGATFANEVSGIVQKETRTWMEEFQNILKKLDETAKAQAESSQSEMLRNLEIQAETSKPGAISVQVENGDECEQGWALIIDDQNPKLCNGKSGAMSNVVPGLRKVTIKGKALDKLIHAEEIVDVSSGEIAKVNVTLS